MTPVDTFEVLGLGDRLGQILAGERLGPLHRIKEHHHGVVAEAAQGVGICPLYSDLYC